MTINQIQWTHINQQKLKNRKDKKNSLLKDVDGSDKATIKTEAVNLVNHESNKV